MSVSLQEVINDAGYDLNLYEDCVWLLSKQNEFEQLIEAAKELVYNKDEKDSENDDEA